MRRAARALLLAAAPLVACSGLAPRPAVGPSGPDLPQILVTLPPAPPAAWEHTARELAAAYGLYVYRAWRMASLDLPCIVYGVPPGLSPERVLARMAVDHRVESVQPVRRFEVLGQAAARPRGDPYGHLQKGTLAVQAGAAHRWATGRGVRVAVIDTGVDVGHPDLAGRIVQVDDFVDRGGFTRDVHGTAVAGVIAAVADNGIGITGVAPEAQIVALKACWPLAPGSAEAACDSYTLVQAVDTAIAARVRVIHLSLGGPDDPLLARLLAAAGERGIAVVAAGDPGRPDLGFPASLPGVIAVLPEEGGGEGGGGTAEDAARAPAVRAPGVDVLTTVPGGAYDFLSGSSLAAAFATGVAALLLEREPRLPPADLARLLGESARPAAEPAPGAVAGSRGLDACGAVTRLLELPAEACLADPRSAR